MKQNQEHISCNNVLPLVECLPLYLSSHQCIFCEKLDVKDGASKLIERPELFSSCKNRANTWQQIESQAKKMGLDRLHRLVKHACIPSGLYVICCPFSYWRTGCPNKMRSSSLRLLYAKELHGYENQNYQYENC